MASDKNTLLATIEAAEIGRDTSTATALASEATAGASTIAVDSDANFADGDPLRVGDEFSWVDGTPASDVITLGRPLKRTHPVDTAVVKQVVYDTGPILEGTANASMSGSSTDIPVEAARLPIATLDGPKTAQMTWSQPSFTPALFALATGMNLTRVLGSGTAAAPTYVKTSGAEFAEVPNQTYIVRGKKVGGTETRLEGWNASTLINNLTIALARNQATPVPFAASTPSWMFYDGDHEYTVDNSHAAKTGTVWNYLNEVFLLIKSATTTTLNGAVNAGASAVVLTSGTSFNNDDWVLVEAGGGVEVTQLKDKSTNNFNLKIAAYRDWGNGVTITKLDMVQFADITPAGVSLSMNVTQADRFSALSATAVHSQLGQAVTTINFAVMNWTLANIAYALGIPASDIANSALLADGSNIGTASIPAVAFKGVTKNGATTMLIGEGTSLDLASIAMTLTKSGEGTSLPMSWKPGSCLTMLQYS